MKIQSKTEFIIKNPDGTKEISSLNVVTYLNDKGQPIKTESWEGDEHHVATYTYDKNGRLVRYYSYPSEDNHYYKKDDEGNQVEIIESDEGSDKWERVIVTSEEGNRIYEALQVYYESEDGGLNMEPELQFEVERKFCDGVLVSEKGGELLGSLWVDYETNYTYRKEGDKEITESVKTYENGKVETFVKTVIKDEKGREIEVRDEENGKEFHVKRVVYESDNRWTESEYGFVASDYNPVDYEYTGKFERVED